MLNFLLLIYFSLQILKKSKEEKTTKKRMTLGPDKLDDVLNKNFLHKNSDIGYAVHSFKGSNKKEDDEMTFSSFDKEISTLHFREKADLS